MTEPGGTSRATLIKCVVWDIDNTLLNGIYLESGDQPPAADPELATVLAELSGRGILHALASKNPPGAAAHTARVTGADFAAVRCGWDRKSDAVSQIAAELGLGVDTLAFVDDDPYERAEVAAALPDVLVLSPEDAAEAPRWAQFSPPVLTAEGRRRGQMYAQRRQRQAAEQVFRGGRDEFLRWAGTQVTIAAAAPGDVPRLHELALRTRQFNTGPVLGIKPDWFSVMLADTDIEVIAVRLRDKFGDDGMVGGCVVDHGDPQSWAVQLLMMSCRAIGRGVIDALLAWLAILAARRGAQRLRVPCVVNERNLPLRLALARAGFRAGEPGEDGATVFERVLDPPLPDLPDWVSAPGGPATETA